MRELIEAPEPILVYLCLYSNVHQVPVGNEQTQQNLTQILPNISEFNRIYTNMNQYSFVKSRYTQKISSSSSQVPDSFWLTSSIDTQKLAEYERKDADLKRKISDLSENMKSINEKKQQIEKKLEEIRKQLNELREKRGYIDQLKKKITSKEIVLRKLEEQNIDLVSETRQRMQTISELSKKKAKLFADYVNTAKDIVLLNRDKILVTYEDSRLQQEKITIESEMRNFNSRKQELEAQMENASALLKETRDNARIYLEAASKMNQHPLEKGLPEEHKTRFAKLPDSVERLETEIHACEARSQISHDVDERVVEDYNKRKKRIEELREDFNKKNDKLRKHQDDYEGRKNDWLQKVETMISEINEKFSLLFKQLKCEGQICLGRPDNAEEFAKYGITIKVSFRSDERLQELTAWQQSGGEKSVATMMYMIALQEMTKCPFRVVDEINQGMDPVNERKVFDIIVQNSCSKQQAQYFLLTPKLLPDLAFDDRTNVICVFNGPHNITHSKYNLRTFLDIRRSQKTSDNQM